MSELGLTAARPTNGPLLSFVPVDFVLISSKRRSKAEICKRTARKQQKTAPKKSMRVIRNGKQRNRQVEVYLSYCCAAMYNSGKRVAETAASRQSISTHKKRQN